MCKYIFYSENNFDEYSIYCLMNEFNKNNEQFDFILNKEEPGSYSYINVARDYLIKLASYSVIDLISQYKNHLRIWC